MIRKVANSTKRVRWGLWSLDTMWALALGGPPTTAGRTTRLGTPASNGCCGPNGSAANLNV
eukprot:1194207-Prorocentrum_minimum.AAC.2